MAFIRRSSAASEKSGFAQKYVTSPDMRLYNVQDLFELARKHDINTAPLDVHSLTAALGIDLLCVPMDDEVSGELKCEEGADRWLIKVNALHHPNRQRFTIAHELAHFSLHRVGRSDFVDQNFFRNGDSSPMEAEANRFASELLMPESEFRSAAKKLSGKIESIAQYFEVSVLAVRVRAKTLGMKGHGL
ncbi:ImmA/IrrE family metallo-endopeptidase [Stutzerimonas kunmingensis]|uniref:ImmA/IrrE family metallo-endopeptidase n=1 Tax=Stutzerimonas kunmingensis TaxID=1211807 RepID=UPI003524401E